MAQKAQGLLPPEILEHYKKGEYVEPDRRLAGRQVQLAAGLQGRDRVERGQVQDRLAGRDPRAPRPATRPPYILGYPFPRIDPKDPQAGVKIMWNQFYRVYYFGNIYAESQLNMVSPDRRRATDRRRSRASCSSTACRVDERVPNPQNFLSQGRTIVVSPTDLNGTAPLSWRYRDPGKRDSSWAYVPALRRVRAVSARPIAPTASSAPTWPPTTAPSSTASRKTSIGRSRARSISTGSRNR